MAGGQVLEELVEITAEVAHVAGSNEGEDSSVAVGALEKLPLGAENGGSGKRGGSGRRDGKRSAVRAEPDHNLVLVVGTNRRGEPQVVGHISDHVGSGVS